MEQLTLEDVLSIYEFAPLSSVSVWHRRRRLLALANLALGVRSGLDPLLRWRIKVFRNYLLQLEGDDEIEVTSEIVNEMAMHAIGAFRR